MARPPEQTASEKAVLSRVIWAFWAVAIFLGLPIWLATTSIYRASLPTDEMLATLDNLTYNFTVCLKAFDIPESELTSIAQRAESLLKEQADFINFQVRRCTEQSEPSGLSIQLKHDAQNDFAFDDSAGFATLMYPEPDGSAVAEHLARTLFDKYIDEVIEVARLLHNAGRASDAIQRYESSLQGRSSKAFKASPNYHLTFSLFSAGPAPSSWDVQGAIDSYIRPIVLALANVADISITTQVQLYSSFSPSVQPQYSDFGWTLQESDLTSFINTAEWPLSPSVGGGPTVNFIVYVPDVKHIPLHVGQDQIDSWLIPQYGAVTILNPGLVNQEDSELGLKHLPAHLDQEEISRAFKNFQSQLLRLLGVPDTDKLPLRERLRSFKRTQGFALYLHTSSSLQALARLEQHLNNIPIPKHVLVLVQDALHGLSEFKRGFSLQPLRTAFLNAEKAFFDKAMVGQVYFPDEHKVAVYLPLLGPIGVPLIIGFVREFKALNLVR